MDFDFTDDEEQLRRELRQFVDEHMRPDWSHLDRDMPTQAEIDDCLDFCQGLADRGLLTPQWPAEYGGRDATLWEQCVISEELWGAGEPRAPQYMNVNWIGPAIMALGTPEQKAYHLKRISAGDVLWCQGFSEPDAGSDLSALRTRAIRDGDVYIVNGQKIWTSYAHAAEFCFLLVRTDPDAENPRDGISILLVPMDLPGIEVREIPSLETSHLIHEVFFNDVAVPVDCRLGEENEGWKIIRVTLANERVGNARHEWNLRMFDAVLEEAEALELDTDEQFWATLGRYLSYTAAARVLNYVAVDAANRDLPERDTLASVYRAQMAQMELGTAHAFLDLLGSEALVKESRGDYQQKSGLLSTIGAGSLEMQLNNVARFALGLPKGN